MLAPFRDVDYEGADGKVSECSNHIPHQMPAREIPHDQAVTIHFAVMLHK